MIKIIDTTANSFLWHVVMAHRDVYNALLACERNILTLGAIVEGGVWNTEVDLLIGDKTYKVKIKRFTGPTHMELRVLCGDMMWQYSDKMPLPNTEELVGLCVALDDVERMVIIDWIFNPISGSFNGRSVKHRNNIMGQGFWDNRATSVVYVSGEQIETEVRYPLGDDNISLFRAVGTIGTIAHSPRKDWPRA